MPERNHYVIQVDVKHVEFVSAPVGAALGRGGARERFVTDVTHVVQKADTLVGAIETVKAMLEILTDQEASDG